MSTNFEALNQAAFDRGGAEKTPSAPGRQLRTATMSSVRIPTRTIQPLRKLCTGKRATTKRLLN